MEELFEVVETDELKVVYRLLHKNLLQEPSLMDSEFLQSLQTYLQKKAVADGGGCLQSWCMGRLAAAIDLVKVFISL